PGLRVLLVAAVMAGFASEAVDRLSVARLDQIGLQTEGIDPAIIMGAVAVLQSLGAAALLWVAAGSLRGRRLVVTMSVLHLATAVGVAVLARVDVLGGALVGILTVGMTREVARTATIGWTNHFTDRRNRATVHSFVGQAGSLGEISGGIGLGLVARQVGIGAALTASALTYLAAAAVVVAGRSRWSSSASP
ncbi:MAG: hypothetical protein AAF480_14385, partial [Actinomycetota bacterium]